MFFTCECWKQANGSTWQRERASSPCVFALGCAKQANGCTWQWKTCILRGKVNIRCWKQANGRTRKRRFFKTLATVFKNGGQTLPGHSKVAPEAAPESNLNRILKNTPYLHGPGRPKGAEGAPKDPKGVPKTPKNLPESSQNPSRKTPGKKHRKKRSLGHLRTLKYH